MDAQTVTVYGLGIFLLYIHLCCKYCYYYYYNLFNNLLIFDRLGWKKEFFYNDDIFTVRFYVTKYIDKCSRTLTHSHLNMFAGFFVI